MAAQIRNIGTCAKHLCQWATVFQSGTSADSARNLDISHRSPRSPDHTASKKSPMIPRFSRQSLGLCSKLCSVSLGSSGATTGLDRGAEPPYPMRIRPHRRLKLTFEELRVIEDQLQFRWVHDLCASTSRFRSMGPQPPPAQHKAAGVCRRARAPSATRTEWPPRVQRRHSDAAPRQVVDLTFISAMSGDTRSVRARE